MEVGHWLSAIAAGLDSSSLSGVLFLKAVFLEVELDLDVLSAHVASKSTNLRVSPYGVNEVIVPTLPCPSRLWVIAIIRGVKRSISTVCDLHAPLPTLSSLCLNCLKRQRVVV